MYTIQYFIDFFSAIPEDQWTTHVQQNYLGQRCAFGHCMPLHLKTLGDKWVDSIHGGHLTPEGIALLKLKFPSANDMFMNPGGIHHINNGDHPMFQQPTPKQRVLAALEWLKEQEANKVITEALAKKEGEETPIPSTVEC